MDKYIKVCYNIKNTKISLELFLLLDKRMNMSRFNEQYVPKKERAKGSQSFGGNASRKNLVDTGLEIFVNASSRFQVIGLDTPEILSTMTNLGGDTLQNASGTSKVEQDTVLNILAQERRDLEQANVLAQRIMNGEIGRKNHPKKT